MTSIVLALFLSEQWDSIFAGRVSAALAQPPTFHKDPAQTGNAGKWQAEMRRSVHLFAAASPKLATVSCTHPR